jgi:hypothetical protein
MSFLARPRMEKMSLAKNCLFNFLLIEFFNCSLFNVRWLCCYFIISTFGFKIKRITQKLQQIYHAIFTNAKKNKVCIPEALQCVDYVC